jgi:hypothetical protein
MKLRVPSELFILSSLAREKLLQDSLFAETDKKIYYRIDDYLFTLKKDDRKGQETWGYAPFDDGYERFLQENDYPF